MPSSNSSRLFRPAIAVMACLLSLAASALAQATRFVDPDQAGSGSLLLKSTEPGKYVEAPLVATDFDVTITGPIARTRVTQRFENPADGWVEGVYVYPLPENSAVDVLKMVIGRRVIIADIKEKQEAKIIYEEAKAAGQKAALLEQERPNLFTNSVANIGPHETVVIQMEYQEAIRQTSGAYQLRLPLVMGPRYIPDPQVTLNANTELVGINDPVPDRSRIEPPVLDPRLNAPVNPVNLTIRLNPGFEPREVTSLTHVIAVEKQAGDRMTVRLKEDSVPADRDFVLNWSPNAGQEPTVAAFTEFAGTDGYLLAYVNPPSLTPHVVRTPREVVFVIDNSGSMGGPSMSQAKASLIYALGRLDPADRFNVIRFDDTLTRFFPDAVPATAANIEMAKQFVGSLEAEGGTEMVPALRSALEDRSPGDDRTLRQVVFLTDGDIGNEEELFNVLGSMLGRSRLFMVGIGSAPNSYLMSRASEIGRGSFTHISTGEEVEDRMRELLGKLESPAMTALAATLSGASDLTPNPVPDLYRGDPIVILGKLQKKEGALEVVGTLSGQPWRKTVAIAVATEGQGIAKLWARRKIADAEVAASLGRIKTEEADKRILELALAHHLVSRMTSLVAVDKTPSRDPSLPLTRAEVPLNLPYGWDFDKVFGENKDTRRAAIGDPKLIAIATQPVSAEDAARKLTLPQTATPSAMLIWLGLAALASALTLAGMARIGARP